MLQYTGHTVPLSLEKYLPVLSVAAISVNGNTVHESSFLHGHMTNIQYELYADKYTINDQHTLWLALFWSNPDRGQSHIESHYGNDVRSQPCHTHHSRTAYNRNNTTTIRLTMHWLYTVHALHIDEYRRYCYFLFSLYSRLAYNREIKPL